MKTTLCPECHHPPSCRFQGDGLQCYCKCHTAADAAPDLLAACKGLLESADAGREEEGCADYSRFAKAARTAIAKAEGRPV